MDTMLATSADAQLVLKLYELRTEAVLRKAREWMVIRFWPQSAEEVLRVHRDLGTEENAWLRQVNSYWEMAAALALHGAVDANLFLDCNGESLFLLAKFHPFLREIQAEWPNFLVKTEELTVKFPAAGQKLENLIPIAAKMSAGMKQKK